MKCSHFSLLLNICSSKLAQKRNKSVIGTTIGKKHFERNFFPPKLYLKKFDSIPKIDSLIDRLTVGQKI